MDLKRCPNGHFYDGEKFANCPHCQGAGPVNPTVPFTPQGNDPMIGGDSATVTVPVDNGSGIGINGIGINNVQEDLTRKGVRNNIPTDDAKTVGFFGVVPSNPGEEAIEPVVGWLVCTQGKRKGKEFRLKAGRNFIGRSANMDVALEGENSVSREGHAIVAYEPHQSIFIAQPGSASELFYLNGDVVLSATQIKRNDRLQLGEVELMLIPCCDENFRWEKEKKPEY